MSAGIFKNGSMLRRRRSCCPEELSFDLSTHKQDGLPSCDNRAKKMKMSPFPEVVGEDLTKTNHQKTTRKQPVSPDTVPSEAIAVSEDNSQPLLKPSQILEIQKAMSVTNQPSIGINEASPANLTSMWDGLLTWMKSAIDFVGLETTPTADITSKALLPRKRPLQEVNQFDVPAKRVSKSRSKNRRMTLVPGTMKQQRSKERRRSIETSPLALKSLQSPTIGLSSELSQLKFGHKVCTTRSLLHSAEKYQTNSKGLNGLMESPKLSNRTWNIRNPSLRSFYMDSSFSNVHTIVEETQPGAPRRSPRLAAKQVSAIPPPPPPPPPPPSAPLLSCPPPPPPCPSLINEPGSQDSIPMSGQVKNRNKLQQMQNRLRTRMMKKTGVEAESKTSSDTVLNFKSQQWVEIQAHKRKIPVADFLVLVKTKQSEVQIVLEQLQSEMPSTLEELSAVVERLQDASLWFPGGYREMKEELPLYRFLEKKIETMNECVQIQNDIKFTVADSNSILNRSYSDLHNYLEQVRDEFNHKHKQWGPTLQSTARSWTDSGLPVDEELLLSAQEYLGQLVSRFTVLVTEEGGKIEGVVCAVKSTRLTKLKEKLKEGLTLLTNCLISSPPAQCTLCGDCNTTTTYCSVCVHGLLVQAAVLATTYIAVCIKEYDGHIHCSKRQDVCEHFEGILKINSLLQSIIKKTYLASQARTSGLITVLPQSEQLGSVLYTSCVKLIQHIANHSQHVMSSPSKDTSREIILWMMFGCKYVNQTLEVLGNEQADERGVQNLLNQLQQMENLLPE